MRLTKKPSTIPSPIHNFCRGFKIDGIAKPRAMKAAPAVKRYGAVSLPRHIAKPPNTKMTIPTVRPNSRNLFLSLFICLRSSNMNRLSAGSSRAGLNLPYLISIQLVLFQPIRIFVERLLRSLVQKNAAHHQVIHLGAHEA